MTLPQNWQACAHNQVPHSQNQIHGDEIAQRLGYTGALVPGVAQSAYLIHPAIEAWGEQWLKHGHSEVVILNPLYDGVEFEVKVSHASEDQYQAELINASGVCCSKLTAKLKPQVDASVDFEYAGLLGDQPEVEATRENMQMLREQGMKALFKKWHSQHDMAHYLADAQAMPELLRFDNGQGFANASFVLGLADWVLAGNAQMNPWVHLQTDCQNLQLIAPNDELVVEAKIDDLFSKKGHEFVDISAHVFKQSDHSLCNIIKLRAIYKLRQSVE